MMYKFLAQANKDLNWNPCFIDLFFVSISSIKFINHLLREDLIVEFTRETRESRGVKVDPYIVMFIL